MISYRLLIGISIAALLGVFLLVRGMHRLSLRVQFMVLLGLGVTIGFIFLVMVQMPSFPEWFGVSLIAGRLHRQLVWHAHLSAQHVSGR